MNKEKNNFSLKFSDLKEFFVDNVGVTNSLILCMIFIQLATIWLVIYVYLEIGDNHYHFYMNTKTSLEQIHNVKIDSYDGSLEKELTTEDKLLRRSNRRFHLRYFFK